MIWARFELNSNKAFYKKFAFRVELRLSEYSCSFLQFPCAMKVKQHNHRYKNQKTPQKWLGIGEIWCRSQCGYSNVLEIHQTSRQRFFTNVIRFVRVIFYLWLWVYFYILLGAKIQIVYEVVLARKIKYLEDTWGNSIICRPWWPFLQFQSSEVETLNAASTHEDACFRSLEAGWFLLA